MCRERMPTATPAAITTLALGSAGCWKPSSRLAEDLIHQERRRLRRLTGASNCECDGHEKLGDALADHRHLEAGWIRRELPSGPKQSGESLHRLIVPPDGR